MAARVLAKTCVVNANSVLLILTVRSQKGWEPKRTQHQTLRRFSTPVIVRAAACIGSSPLGKQPQPKLIVI